MSKKHYAICRYYIDSLYYMAIDGSFYRAIHESVTPKLDSVSEARVFFNTHAHKHHNPTKDTWIEGPKKGVYKI